MVEAIKRGDALAFEQAYNTYRAKVYGWLLKKTGSAEDARDLLQTVFFKLWKYRHTLNPHYTLDQHLFNIARGVFIDYLRVNSKKPSFTHTFTEELATPGTDFETQQKLQQALSSMPVLRRKIFILNRLQGYSYTEIAHLLSIPAKTVDNNISRALKALRKMFISVLILLFTLF